METKKKVLVIDDELIYGAKRVKELDSRNPLPNLDYLDLTQRYYPSESDKNNEILVLNEPKHSRYNVNTIYYWLKGDDESKDKLKYHNFSVEDLKDQFDFKNAINKIKKINPDLILLDMGIPCFCPEEIMEEYIYNTKKMSNNVRNLDGKFHDVEVPILYHLKNTQRRDYKLNCAGGVILGYYLDKEKIPFSFWTADYGHGVENMQIANVLGVLSDEEISSFANQNYEIYQKIKGSYINEIGKYVLHGKEGKLIASSTKSPFKGNARALEKIIEIASNCKKER